MLRLSAGIQWGPRLFNADVVHSGTYKALHLWSERGWDEKLFLVTSADTVEGVSMGQRSSQACPRLLESKAAFPRVFLQSCSSWL